MLSGRLMRVCFGIRRLMTITVFARLYFQLGEYEKAVDAYEKLQARNEDNTVLFRAIGGCVSEFIVSDWGYIS